MEVEFVLQVKHLPHCLCPQIANIKDEKLGGKLAIVREAVTILW